MRTINTLFMLTSLDWKISTWSNDLLDFDVNFPNINWLKEWLNQYYELEQQTDLVSLNSWRVMAKIWMNRENISIDKIPVDFVIIDNTHLNQTWIQNLLNKVQKLYLITTNKNHIAFSVKNSNLEIIYYPDKIDFKNLFETLKIKYNIQNITIQSGGTLNSIFFKEKLIDYINIVVAPCIVWGKNTMTIVSWDSFETISDLEKINVLELIECNKLKNNYLNLKYKVL